jgi:hypothetical protein
MSAFFLHTIGALQVELQFTLTKSHSRHGKVHFAIPLKICANNRPFGLREQVVKVTDIFLVGLLGLVTSSV